MTENLTQPTMVTLRCCLSLRLSLVTTGAIGIIGATRCRTDSLTFTAFLVSNTEWSCFWPSLPPASSASSEPPTVAQTRLRWPPSWCRIPSDPASGPRYHRRHRHHRSHPLSHGLAYVHRLPGVEYRVILLLALIFVHGVDYLHSRNRIPINNTIGVQTLRTQDISAP